MAAVQQLCIACASCFYKARKQRYTKPCVRAEQNNHVVAKWRLTLLLQEAAGAPMPAATPLTSKLELPKLKKPAHAVSPTQYWRLCTCQRQHGERLGACGAYHGRFAMCTKCRKYSVLNDRGCGTVKGCWPQNNGLRMLCPLWGAVCFAMMPKSQLHNDGYYVGTNGTVLEYHGQRLESRAYAHDKPLP